MINEDLYLTKIEIYCQNRNFNNGSFQVIFRIFNYTIFISNVNIYPLLIVLHTYKSTKSALDLTLRKRREDLPAIHQETGIAKRLTRNEQKQYSHAVLICKYGNSRNDICKNGWAPCPFILLVFNLAISFLRMKASTLSLLTRRFLPPDIAKIRFLPEHDALLYENLYWFIYFFTKIRIIIL